MREKEKPQKKEKEKINLQKQKSQVQERKWTRIVPPNVGPKKTFTSKRKNNEPSDKQRKPKHQHLKVGSEKLFPILRKPEPGSCSVK